MALLPSQQLWEHHAEAGVAEVGEALVVADRANRDDQDWRTVVHQARRLGYQLTEVTMTRDVFNWVLERISEPSNSLRQTMRRHKMRPSLMKRIRRLNLPKPRKRTVRKSSMRTLRDLSTSKDSLKSIMIRVI